MKSITLIGAGRIGQLVAANLLHSGDYRLTVMDSSAASLAQLTAHPRLRTQAMDIASADALAGHLNSQFAVLNAAPFALAGTIAEAAHRAAVHYLDLTEDVHATCRVQQLAADARRAMIPQCGLAPGFITILGNDLARRFERLHELRLRVGALPQFPSNALGYNLTWSTAGLINQYCEPGEVIADGERRMVPSLSQREEFLLDGVKYEAFSTAGGIGSLCATLAGRVQHLNYRTIRYPGHAAGMQLLLNDLRLREPARRGLLKDLLEHALPTTLQDVVIVFATASGYRDGRLEQHSHALKVYADRVHGAQRSAIQITTAAGLCAVLDLLAQGRLPQQGLVRQEDIPLADFLNNRFGSVYAGATLQPQHLTDAA